MRRSELLLLGMICSCLAFSQIDPSKIDIVRDEDGVPHIYAATMQKLPMA